MKVKYMILTLLSLIFLVSSVNAGITQLTSCGKSSGWLDNEVYVLNFTQVSQFYTNNWCFQFLDSAVSSTYPYILHNNITFLGVGNIDIDKTGNFYFFDFQHTAITNHFHQVRDFQFIDLSLTDNINNGNKYFVKIFTNGGGNHKYSINAPKIDNLTLNNFYATGYYKLGALASGTLKNSKLDLKYVGDGINTGQTVGFRNMHVNASLFNIKNGWNINIPYNDINIFNNSVILIPNYVVNSPTTYFYNSILKNYPHVDSNNDGIANSDIYANMFNMRIFLPLFNYNFFQDAIEGDDLITPSAGLGNVYVESTTLGTTDPNGHVVVTNGNGDLNEFSGTTLINSKRGLRINGGIDCSLVTDVSCLIQDDGTFIQTTAIEYKPLIEIGSSQKFRHMNFNKVSNANDNQLIGIGSNVTYSNILFEYNSFNRSDELSKTGTINSNHFIKLNGNNLTIRNNEFNMLGVNISTIYEILDIKGTLTSANNVYLNTFTNLITTPTNPSEVFTLNAVTRFYNNYLGSDVVITNNSGLSSQLNATALIGFKHTDNKIYYYYIGNYYSDNVGCVDSNSDGFCDSPYTSGVITDTKPLSVYPFDYTAHLFTAFKVVDTTLFNITTLVNNNILNNNININVVDVNSVINLSFYHDSLFPDLTCDYIVNGASVNDTTISKPNQNQTYTIPVTGWNVGLNTYRVECFNNFGTKLSNEYTLNVSYGNNGGGNTNNGGGNTNNGGNSGSTSYSSIDVIDYNSVDNTNANTIGFMQDIIGFVTNIGIPLGILLVVIISVFAVLRLLM